MFNPKLSNILQLSGRSGLKRYVLQEKQQCLVTLVEAWKMQCEMCKLKIVIGNMFSFARTKTAFRSEKRILIPGNHAPSDGEHIGGEVGLLKEVRKKEEQERRERLANNDTDSEEERETQES